MMLEWEDAPEKAEFILVDGDGYIDPSFVYDAGDRYQEVDSHEYLLKIDLKNGWYLEPRP